MSDLLIIPPLTMHRAPSGKFVLTRKFLDGVAAYAHYFPGKVTALLGVDATPTTDLDHVEFDQKEHPFAIDELPVGRQQLAARLGRAKVVLGSLCFDSDVELTELCAGMGIPVVLITEYSLATRRQIIAVTTTNPLRRWKQSFGAGKLEKRLCVAAQIATGLQCNGTPTYEAYKRLNPRTLLFFDTRIRHPMLPSRERVERRIAHMVAGAPLRLAFSGRLIAMKGADHLPLVAHELKNREVPFTLDICGAGELEGSIAATVQDLKLGDCVRMRGNLDFARELVPLITDGCDLFVQCHPQGDPSCTYLETMACATPIAGYENEAFGGVVRASGTGFATAMNNPGQLAEKIAGLHKDRATLAEAGRAALRFAEEHTFEKTMQARVEHLMMCMRSGRARAEMTAAQAQA